MGVFEKGGKRAASSDTDDDDSAHERDDLALDDSEDGFLAAPPPPSYGDAVSSPDAALHRVRLSDLLVPSRARSRPDILSQYIVQRHVYAKKSSTSAADDDSDDDVDEKGTAGSQGSGRGRHRRKISSFASSLTKSFKGKEKAKADDSTALPEGASSTAQQPHNSDGGAKTGAIQLRADTRRIYVPGEAVQATVQLPATDDGGTGYEALTCELKGELRTFAIIHGDNGAQYVVHSTHSLFSHTATLHKSDGRLDSAKNGIHASPADVKASSNGGASRITSTSQTDEGSTAAASAHLVSPPGARQLEWQFNTALPRTFVDKDGATKPLPSTFNGRGVRSYSNWILYSLKVTGHRAGMLKRHDRVWLPILVIADPHSSDNGISSSIARLLPSPPPPPSSAAARQIPADWILFRTGATLRRNMVQEKAIVLVDAFFPRLDAVAGNDQVPLAVRVTALAKESVYVDPRLGGSSSARSGAGGECILPDLVRCLRVALRRTDWSKASGVTYTATKEYGVPAQWAEVDPSSPEADGGWTTPAPYDAAAAATLLGGPSAGSTTPTPTASQTRRLFPKSAPKLPTPSSGYVFSTSTIQGIARLRVCPAVELAKLRVSYDLLLRCRLESKNVKENLKPLAVPALRVEAGAGTGERETQILGDEGAKALMSL